MGDSNMKGGPGMESILIPTGDEGIILTAQAAARLLERGDGDAALLYLALLRRRGAVQPRSLAGELRWERPRIESAEQTLRELGLIAPAADSVPPPEMAGERPVYQRGEIADRLEQSASFQGLTAEVEKRLGKKLSSADLGILLGLHDYLGLPADVIYLLVCHCAEQVQQRYGDGRRPAMRQIEKEGYAWARMGIGTQAEAAAYLKKYARRREAMPQYMRVLGLGDRLPAASEERYLSSWLEMGFPPETVALAYDKTVLKCHELRWPYLNGILRRWHEANLHTPEEVEAGDRAAGERKPVHSEPRRRDDVAWMKKYIQQRDKGV